MNVDDKRKIGEQIEPGGRPKAPGRLELLQRFVNTWNHDLPTAWDRIGTPRRAQAWLRKAGLIDRRATVVTNDVTRLREFREALRAIVAANATEAVDPTAIDTLQTAALQTALTVMIDDQGRTRLRACSSNADGAIATLLSIVYEAQLTGHWIRLKACRECRYAFFDRSRNRSATWCSMSICGNRSKNREYYRRLHPPA